MPSSFAGRPKNALLLEQNKETNKQKKNNNPTTVFAVLFIDRFRKPQDCTIKEVRLHRVFVKLASFSLFQTCFEKISTIPSNYIYVFKLEVLSVSDKVNACKCNVTIILFTRKVTSLLPVSVV